MRPKSSRSKKYKHWDIEEHMVIPDKKKMSKQENILRLSMDRLNLKMDKDIVKNQESLAN